MILWSINDFKLWLASMVLAGQGDGSRKRWMRLHLPSKEKDFTVIEM